MSVENGGGTSAEAQYNNRFNVYPGDFSIANLDDLAPVLDYEQTKNVVGLNGEVIAAINTENKQFLVLDLTKEPKGDGYRILEDSTGALTAADYMLIDTDFDTATNRGLKSIIPDGSPIRLGKKHNQDRFKFPAGSANEVLEIWISDFNQLCIKNLQHSSIEVIQNERPVRVYPKPTEIEWEPIDVSAELDEIDVLTDERDSGELTSSHSVPIREKESVMLFSVGVAEKPLKNEDRHMVDYDGMMFGVFDGAGGEGNGDIASNAAYSECKKLSALRNASTTSLSVESARSGLVQILEEANNAVIEQADGGITTATVARIVYAPNPLTRNNEPYVVWAHAGDSRLYLLRENKVEQLTLDEGHGHGIYNYLGYGSKRGEIEQSGSAKLYPSDMLILVTDGITGDVGDELLEPAEIEVACRNKTALQAAEKLLEISRKRDDKTAIVVKFNG